MQLAPRYDGPPITEVAEAPFDPGAVLVAQRRRLVDVVGALDDDAWAAPSRCSEWAARDVVAHLVDADRFWVFSVGAGRSGRPSRFLATFDPVAGPAQLVTAHAAATPTQLTGALASATEDLAEALAGLDADGWTITAEAPLGHVPLRALALHALWDGWTHERDILLPLGHDPQVVDDEVAACLLWAAAIGPAFASLHGSAGRGRLAVVADDRDLAVEVDHGVTVRARWVPAAAADGDLVVRGPAVALVEGLTLRAPLPDDVPAERRWLLGALAQTFDQPLP